MNIGRQWTDRLKMWAGQFEKHYYTPRGTLDMCCFTTMDALTFEEASFTYQMSILKSADAEGSACNRFTFSYAPIAGVGHFLHTYNCDGNPIPTFTGEPERVSISGDIDSFTKEIWENLNEKNKISLYVRFTDLATGKTENRMINKNA